jgi:transcriptional regulator with XRE-family HTH domain
MPRTNLKTVSPAHVRRPKRNRISLLLNQAGSSASEVARLAEVSPAHVTKVMKGESKSARIQKIIESILKKPWDKLVAAQS